MTRAWEIELPHSQKLVLLSLADNANDRGDCWPSITTIAEKCCMHRSTVMRMLNELEIKGQITRSIEPGMTNGYRIHPSHIATTTAAHPSQAATSIESEPPQGSTIDPAQSQAVTSSDPSQAATSIAASTRSRQRLVAERDATRRRERRVPVAGCDPTRRRLRPRNVMESSDEPSENLEQVRAARATRLPEDFELTPERRLVAETEAVPAERTFEKFRDHFRAASGAKARKVNWDAAWRNWCRTEADFRGGRPATTTDPAQAKAQTERAALRKLIERRAAIGLAHFREPRAGESSDDYRAAQDAAWNARLREREAAPRELVERMRPPK